MSITAFTGAVFDRTVNSLAGIERFSAVGARHCTTFITNQSCSRSWRKFSAALTAFLNRHNNRKWGFAFQFGMAIPKILFGYAVTGGTHSLKIFKAVCFPVVIKQSEWNNVMNRETSTLYTAPLAGIVITDSRCSTLSVPVCAAISTVPAAPRGILTTRVDTVDRAPFAVTFTTTKIEFENLARNFFKLRAAVCTYNGDAISALADVVFRLPRSVALKTAKWLFSHCRVIALALDWLSAFSTVYGNHSCIITHMDNCS